MITGLNNLGPSLPAISPEPQKAKPGEDSFKEVLQTKSADRKETAKAANTPKKDTMFLPKDDDVSLKAEPRMAPEDTESRDEMDTVREKKRVDKVGKEKSDSDSSDREQVMLKFMDSMESEFGVPPQRMVEAMAKLPNDELASSPEESAPQVISQLNLQPEDQQKALQMYLSFLHNLNNTAPAKEVAAESVATTGGKAALAMPGAIPLISSQERRDRLNHSLDQLNSKFFMKADRQESFQRDGEPMVTRESSMEASGSLMNPNRDSLSPLAGKQNGYGFDPQKLGMTPVHGQAMQQQAQPLNASEQEAADRNVLMQKLAALGAAAGAVDRGLKNDPQNLQALKAEQVLQQNQGQQNLAAAGGVGMAVGNQGDENLDQDLGDSKGDGKDFLSNPSFDSLAAAGSAHSSSSAEAPTFVGAMSATGQVAGQSSAENNPNIRQIMNQAQYMIKKGGGEAKIQLNPEGLGEIHMKVAVRDGKVDLQIATQTHEAKKLVESSMQELRDSLNHRNLGMDAVKVDVGNHLAGDKHHSDSQAQDQSQQKQFDLKQDLARDQSKSQAREFWSQFNDDGFSRRAAVLDSPGIRAYGGGRRPEPLHPADTTSTMSERRYVQSGKGRGLDLVA